MYPRGPVYSVFPFLSECSNLPIYTHLRRTWPKMSSRPLWSCSIRIVHSAHSLGHHRLHVYRFNVYTSCVHLGCHIACRLSTMRYQITLSDGRLLVSNRSSYNLLIFSSKRQELLRNTSLRALDWCSLEHLLVFTARFVNTCITTRCYSCQSLIGSDLLALCTFAHDTRYPEPSKIPCVDYSGAFFDA